VARSSVNLKFRKDLTDPENDPMLILRKECGYNGTWKLRLVINDDPVKGPRLDPVTGQIVAPRYLDECITVFVPDRPRDVSVDAAMERLAVLYYDANAWLHGGSLPDPTLPALPPPPGPTPEDAPRKRASRYDLGDATSDFLSFVAALFNTVALTWTNEKFKEILTREKAPAGHTIAVLREWLGFEYLWDLDLRIAIDKHAKYVEHPLSVTNERYPRWEIRRPELRLTLPWMTGALDAKHEVEANHHNPGVAMMGLALYNTDGAGYPFTCG
jgi:hypothetical protein